MLAKLLPMIPKTERYIEPFCGAATLFFAKQPGPIEVLNDLDGNIVNLMRVLQDKEQHKEFQHRVQHTLYARAEFDKARLMLDSELSPMDRAWAFFVAINQGFSGKYPESSGNWSRGFTLIANRPKQVNDWLMRLNLIDDWHQRLLGCYIDNIDAIQCIQYWDTSDAFFYVDPPYQHETRSKDNRDSYKHEMTTEQHKTLINCLINIEGQAVISCYNTPTYDALLGAGYQRIEFNTACHAASRTRTSGLQGAGSALERSPRTETVYFKLRTRNIIRQEQFQYG